MAAQVTAALDNLEAVLGAAGMTLADVVRLRIFVTDVDRFFGVYRTTMASRLASAGVSPPATLLESAGSSSPS